MADNILEIKNIHTFIGQFHILEGVSVTVPKGSITVLLGRNGAGKTTTLKSIMGITPPREGTILFEGEPINGKRAFNIAKLGIGYVPEHRAIFKDLSVRENLEIADRDGVTSTRGSTSFLSFSPTSNGSITFPAASCPAVSSKCWRSRGRLCRITACSSLTSQAKVLHRSSSNT